MKHKINYLQIVEIKFLNNLSTELPQFLKSYGITGKIAIICDENSKKLFGVKIFSSLSLAGYKTIILDIKSGESQKNIETITFLAKELLKNNFDRNDLLIALGGGVVGDITGFLASIYMRGIKYVQIPTTLLSMADSSIGGKTGVNLAEGKNLLGTFYNPFAVLININYIKTLAMPQLKSGLAEIIKISLVKSRKLFCFLEKNIDLILGKNLNTIEKIIKESQKLKLQMIKKDTFDQGKRIILNYGHTFGHAIEKITNYKLPHGYAISIGMVMANKIAVEKNYLKNKNAERIKKMLTRAGLPIFSIKKPSINDLMSDKKKQNNYIQLILLKDIGKPFIYNMPCIEEK